MADRPLKLLRFKYDGVCRTCSGDIKAGDWAMWAAGGIAWHKDCEPPHAALNEPFEESKESFDAWCERKIQENEARYAAQVAREQITGGSADADAGSAISDATGDSGEKPEDNGPTAQVNITSDPRYAELF